jgi:hypothetical protein
MGMDMANHLSMLVHVEFMSACQPTLGFLNNNPFWLLNGTPRSCLNDTTFWFLNDTNVGVERYS